MFMQIVHLFSDHECEAVRSSAPTLHHHARRGGAGLWRHRQVSSNKTKTSASSSHFLSWFYICLFFFWDFFNLVIIFKACVVNVGEGIFVFWSWSLLQLFFSESNIQSKIKASVSWWEKNRATRIILSCSDCSCIV